MDGFEAHQLDRLADLYRQLYLALRNQGFSNRQAMAMVNVHLNAMVSKSIGRTPRNFNE